MVLMPMPSASSKKGGRGNGRAIGPLALGSMLWGLGCALTLVEDPVLTARHRKRPDWEQRKETYVTTRPALTLNDMIELRAIQLLEQRGGELASGLGG